MPFTIRVLWNDMSPPAVWFRKTRRTAFTCGCDCGQSSGETLRLMARSGARPCSALRFLGFVTAPGGLALANAVPRTAQLSTPVIRWMSVEMPFSAANDDTVSQLGRVSSRARHEASGATRPVLHHVTMRTSRVPRWYGIRRAPGAHVSFATNMPLVDRPPIIRSPFYRLPT
jgi:hypothetical protein